MTSIPKSITDRIATLRPRLHPFDRIDPARTAFVVIDLQNMFMAEGAIYEVKSARAIVPNVNRLAAALRRAGGLVVWVQMKYDPADPWRNFYDHMLKPETAKAVQAALTPGDPGLGRGGRSVGASSISPERSPGMPAAMLALSLVATVVLAAAVGAGLVWAAVQDGREQRAHATGPRPGMDGV